MNKANIKRCSRCEASKVIAVIKNGKSLNLLFCLINNKFCRGGVAAKCNASPLGIRDVKGLLK